MQDHAQQVGGAMVSGSTIGLGVVADQVYLHEITLNEISIVVGITVGILTAILQMIRIYRALKHKADE